MKSLIFSKAIIISSAFVALTACSKNDLTLPVTNSPETTPHDYHDEATGTITLSRSGRSEPGRWNIYYHLEGNGSASDMTSTRTLCSFSTPSGSNEVPGAGYSLNNNFRLQLAHNRYSDLPDNVSQMVFDDFGNSIWFQIERIDLEKSSSTSVNFTGESKVVGGTGKYAHASGKVRTSGHFNTLDHNTMLITNTGVIKY